MSAKEHGNHDFPMEEDTAHVKINNLSIKAPETPLQSSTNRNQLSKKGDIHVFYVPGSPVPTSVVMSPKGERIFFPGDITKEADDAYKYGGSPRSFGQFSPQAIGKKEVFDVIIRPMDKNWIMGEDWIIKVHRDMKVKYLRAIIEEYRKIPSCRQLLKLLRNSQKIEIVNEDWSLRRLGLLPEDMIAVEPTMTATWLWNPIEYYETKLLEDILKAIDMNEGRASLPAISGLLTPPPPIKISLQRFISQYPDQIHVYTDTTSGIKWIQRPYHEFQLPTYSNYSFELGIAQQLDLPDFNFDDYADIDDTKPLELDFVIPNVIYNIQITSANNLIPSATNSFPNPICILFFNGAEVGRTSGRAKSLNPTWNDAVFVVQVSPNQNIYDCVVAVEVHDTIVNEKGELLPSSLLGYVELRKNDLIGFLCGLYQESFTADLTESKEAFQLISSSADSSKSFAIMPSASRKRGKEGKFGSITMKGGKSGIEISIVSAYGLVEQSDPRSQVFAIVLWNGSEIGRTFPEARRLQSPIWNETFTIPSNFDVNLSDDFVSKLKDCILEIQVWSALGKKTLNIAEYGITPSNKDSSRDEFLGSVVLKSESLVEALTADWPWAVLRRGNLQKSSTLSVSRKRNDRVQGNLTYIIGSAGLNVKRSPPFELTVISADGVTIFERLFYTVEWNYNLIYRSNHIQLQPNPDNYASADLQQKCQLEVDNDSYDLSQSYLKIELFESIVSKGYTIYGEYLGCVHLQGQDALSKLFRNPYASIESYTLQRNPDIDSKRQSLIHGNIKLRGGVFGARTELERILIVHSCSNINHIVDSTSSVFVVISYMNKELGRTLSIDCDRKLFWDQDNLFFVHLQTPTGLIDTQLSNNYDMLVEVCQSNPDPTIKEVLASCRIDSNALHSLLESIDPVEKVYPLKMSGKLRLSATMEPEIVLGTCGTKYFSYSDYREDLTRSFKASIMHKKSRGHSIDEGRLQAMAIY
jgi:hypothetical protein